MHYVWQRFYGGLMSSLNLTVSRTKKPARAYLQAHGIRGRRCHFTEHRTRPARPCDQGFFPSDTYKHPDREIASN